MARIPLGALTTLNTSLHLDPMFIELYAAIAGDFSAVAAMNIGMVGGTRRLNVGGSANISAVLKSTVASGGAGSSALYFGNSGSDTVGYVNYDHTTNFMSLGINGAERLRVDSAGNVGIGVTNPAYKLDVGGASNFAGNQFIRIGTKPLASGNGTTVNYLFSGGATGLIVRNAADTANLVQIADGGNFTPGGDNTQTLGASGARWSVVYAGTGAINTSDAREKTDVHSLTESELQAAIDLANEIGTFQFLSSIEEKGEDGARLHIGMTVQRAIEIMNANGLEPMRYAFICYDEWPEEVVPAVVRFESRDTGLVDEAGEPIQVEEEVEVQPEHATPAGNRYGFRYDQLGLFIARGQEERLRRLEARS